MLLSNLFCFFVLMKGIKIVFLFNSFEGEIKITPLKINILDRLYITRVSSEPK